MERRHMSWIQAAEIRNLINYCHGGVIILQSKQIKKVPLINNDYFSLKATLWNDKRKQKKIPSQRWKSGESLMSAPTMMRAALITRRWIWRVSTQIQWRSASEGELTEPGSSSGSGTGKQPWFPPKHLSQRFSLTRLQPQSQPMCHLTSQASSPESFYKTDAFSVPEDLFGAFPKSVCHFKH